MSGFTFFYVLILIVFAVLNIILFFKIWNMTNNVEKLKTKFANDCNTKRVVIEGDFDFLAQHTIKDLGEKMLNISEMYYDMETRKYNYQDEINTAKKVLEKIDRLSMLPAHFASAEVFCEHYEKYKELFGR
ncbi:MAG: hypothetical protein HUK14_10845 [Muribaculaceae bacterium]|nr:hypothetical protein [Muribaculaceae bacterium]